MSANTDVEIINIIPNANKKQINRIQFKEYITIA